MKAEVDQNTALDKAEREKIDKMNQADSMIFTTENFLKENSKVKAYVHFVGRQIVFKEQGFKLI